MSVTPRKPLAEEGVTSAEPAAPSTLPTSEDGAIGRASGVLPGRRAESADLAPGTDFGSLFRAFLRAGCLGFGGFASLMAMLETVLVKQRKLLTSEQVLNGVSLASLLPGPQAVNVAAYCGYLLRGWRGAWVAGFAVVLPSFVLMVALAALYERYGDLDGVARLFRGFVPAVAAVIASVVWRLAAKSLATRAEIVIATLAAAILTIAAFGLLGFPRSGQLPLTFGVVAAAGVAGWMLFARGQAVAAANVDAQNSRFPAGKVALTVAGAVVLAVIGLARPADDPRGLASIATTFSGLSVMLFGGGYVFVPMMQHEIVDVLGWVGAREFVDGVALSQVMPGPILVAAAFFGWMIAGFGGALVGTFAVFTPPAVIMVVASQAMEHVRRSRVALSSMRGIRAAVVGMIAVAAVVVAKNAIPNGFGDLRTLVVASVLFAGALVALLRFRIDVAWVVPASGAIGWFLFP